MMEQEEKQKGKKTLLASGIALATAASMLVGGLFQAPADFLKDDPQQQVVVMDGSDPELDGGDDGSSEEDEFEEERRGGLRRTARQRILAMPLAVRMVVILPIWLVGSVLNAALCALWAGVSPILGHILSSLLLIALLFSAFLLAIKAMFPDLPINKILNRKTIPWLLAGGLVLSALDRVLLAVVEEYAPVRTIVVSLMFLVFLGGAVLAFSLREHKKRSAKGTVQEAALKTPVQESLFFEDPSGSFRLGMAAHREEKK